MSISISASRNDDFLIIKSDELMIGGYASIEIVDKQNDLITLKALNEAVQKFMSKSEYRNVMTNHSNVQVGEVVDSYRDKTGRLWKTEVDDVGFFVVIKLRDDIEKAKEVGRNIRKGSLRSFSIGGQALKKSKKNHDELGELDALMEEVNTLRKEEEMKEEEMMKPDKETEMADEMMERGGDYMKEDEEMKEDEMAEYSDEENKAYLRTLDGAGNQIGEPADRIVINNGRPTSSDMPVVKAFGNNELETLDLSVGNIEKAYEAFRQEQLEKLAYDNLQKSFEDRFAREKNVRENTLAKSQYDAQSEIASLKDEFTALRKSLTAEKETILKAQEEAKVELPSIDDLAEMDWSDIHKMVGGY